MSARTGTLVSILAILLSGTVYLPSLGGDYVYDDTRFVAENAAVTRGVGFGRYFTDPSTQTAGEAWGGLYRPLRTISFRAVHLVADGPAAQRVANLALHLLSSILVWLLLRRALERERFWPALLGALAFSLHPLASESVAWISSRGDLLAMAGLLTSLLLYLRGGAAAGALSVATFFLALLGKESAAVLVLLIVLADAFEGGLPRVRARWVRYLPHLAALVVYLGIRWLVLGDRFGQGDVPASEPIDRLATALVGGVYYLYTALLPAGLTFELRILSGAAARGMALLGFLLSAGLLSTAFILRCRAPRLALGILWFLAALLPVTLLQIAFPLKIAVANRFAYPALAGLGLILGAAAARGPRFATLTTVVLFAFIPLTTARAAVFSTDRSLWRDVLRSDPENTVANYAAGRLALADGRPEEAKDHLIRSIGVDPRHPDVHVLLGAAFEQLAVSKRGVSREKYVLLAKALNAYNAAIRLWQGGVTEGRIHYGETLVNAAYLAGVQGLVTLARDHARRLLTERPPLPGIEPLRERTIRRLERIAGYLAATGAPGLGGGVREAARRLREESR